MTDDDKAGLDLLKLAHRIMQSARGKLPTWDPSRIYMDQWLASYERWPFGLTIDSDDLTIEQWNVLLDTWEDQQR